MCRFEVGYVHKLSNIPVCSMPQLPGFHNKTRPIATQKTSPIAFRGGFTGKNRIPEGKIQIFWRGSPGKILISGIKYHVFGGKRRLGNTAACQLDASSEDCLDVFDLTWSVCVIKVLRELYESGRLLMLSLAILRCHTPIGLQVEHSSLISCVTWQCNHNLCGWKILFFS